MANKLPSVKEDKNIGERIDRTSAKLKNLPGVCLQGIELKLLFGIAEQRRDKELAKRGLDYSVCFHLNSNQSFTVAIYHGELAVSFSLELNAISVLSSAHRSD